jgi:hypothetical protein
MRYPYRPIMFGWLAWLTVGRPCSSNIFCEEPSRLEAESSPLVSISLLVFLKNGDVSICELKIAASHLIVLNELSPNFRARMAFILPLSSIHQAL